MLRGGLETAYGLSRCCSACRLRIDAGEVATLLGRNGMGKTTTVRSIMGMIAGRRGHASASTAPRITGLPSYRIAQAGIGLVPEGRQIFPNLTVRENLVATAANRRAETDPWTLERVFELFPNLQAARRQLRQPALRRRAADARHRPRADDQPAPADPRRGHRGPRAADPRRDLPLHRAPEGRRPVDPGHRQGREGPDPHRRRALHAGKRPRGVDGQLARTGRATRTCSTAIWAYSLPCAMHTGMALSYA